MFVEYLLCTCHCLNAEDPGGDKEMQFSVVMQLTLKTAEQFFKIGFYFITFTLRI